MEEAKSLEAAWIVLYGTLGAGIIAGAVTIIGMLIQLSSSRKTERDKHRLAVLEQAFEVLNKTRAWSIKLGTEVITGVRKVPEPGESPVFRFRALIWIYFPDLMKPAETFEAAYNEWMAALAFFDGNAPAFNSQERTLKFVKACAVMEGELSKEGAKYR